MQVMIRIGAVALVMLHAADVSAQTRSAVGLAEADRLAAYIQAEFDTFSRDLMHVRLGHQACAYSFVDEQALNDLAERQLGQMIKRGTELIGESTDPVAAAMSPPERAYAAGLAARAAVALQEAAIRAQLEPNYGSGEADCALSAEQNQPRYRSLQQYAAP